MRPVDETPPADCRDRHGLSVTPSGDTAEVGFHGLGAAFLDQILGCLVAEGRQGLGAEPSHR